MKLSNTVNVIDTEYDGKDLIEIGLTTVDLKNRRIIQSYSLPLPLERQVSPEIHELTGWTQAKLNKQGLDYFTLITRLQKYGFENRLLVADTDDEAEFIEYAVLRYGLLTKPNYMRTNDYNRMFLSSSRLNVSILFMLKTGLEPNLGLDRMLEHFNMTFEGKRHRAKDDSYNIARLFLQLIPRCAGNTHEFDLTNLPRYQPKVNFDDEMFIGEWW